MWTKWEIRYRRGPPGVRNMRAVQKTGFCGTRRIFRSTRCAEQASGVQKRYSVPELPSYGTECIFSAHNKKKGCRKTAPPQSIHAGNKPQLFDFDTTRSRNFLLLNTLRQSNVKHTVHHLSLNGVKVNVFRKSKALMV